MDAIVEFTSSDLGLILVGIIAGAVLSSIGWLVKFKTERSQDRLEFVRARSENREAGYKKFLAASSALHYIKAVGVLTGNSDQNNFEKLGIRALAIIEDGVAEVRVNMNKTEPFEKVIEYWRWLFIEDHAPMQSPGITEFDRLRDLLIKCERVALHNEKSSVLKVNYVLDNDNEYKTLIEGASERLVTSDGTIILSFGEGDALADWIEAMPKQQEAWRTSRDLSWLQMQRSGFFGDDLPVRPE